MIPAPVKQAAAQIVADDEQIVSVRVPSNARPKAYAALLRRELNAHYGFSAVKICNETRKNGAWLVVVKPVDTSFTDASKIEKWADSVRLVTYQEGSAI